MKHQIQLFSVVMLAMLFAPGAQAVQCDRTITANIVVLDNPTVFNRLGAQNPNWITYALERDVVVANRLNPNDPANGTPCSEIQCTAGNVELRPDKRPRPLVVRSAAGDCLTVNFTNLLAPNANPNNFIDNPLSVTDNVLINNDQVFDRCASFHAQGVELVGGMDSDGSFVGNNNPGVDVAQCGPNDVKGGLVGPGANTTYTLYTPHEGTFTVNSYGATIGSEANGGTLGVGMFAQLNVQPKDAKMYRSQVTEEELRLATTGIVPSD